MPRASRSRPLAACAALLAALAVAGCRTGAKAPPPPPPPPKPAVNARLAEGVNTISFVAAERSVLHGIALQRDRTALKRAALTGVVALRDACASPEAAVPGALADLCGHLPARLEALKQEAAGDDDDALRLAARGVVEVAIADLRLAQGRSLDLFLRLASGRVLLEGIASDARWPELRRAPPPSLGGSVAAALDAIEDACSDPTTVGPGWDCARAARPLGELRTLAKAWTIDEPARPLVRELLAALPRGR